MLLLLSLLQLSLLLAVVRIERKTGDLKNVDFGRASSRLTEELTQVAPVVVVGAHRVCAGGVGQGAVLAVNERCRLM